MSDPRIPPPELFKAIFEDDRRGAAILDYLERRFSHSVVTTGGIDAVLKTYQLAGRREVVEFIINQINRANGVEVNQEEEN